MEPEIKVTKIKNRWHARLSVNGVVYSEMACANRIDIGYICRQLMRWHDKCGGCGIVAHHSRERLNKKATNHSGPVGKIWYSSYFS